MDKPLPETVPSLRLEVVLPDHPEARLAMRAYFEELAARFTIPLDPDDPALWETDDMQMPGGLFLLARLDGRLAGCGGVRKFDATTGEIKRVWVASNARGKGVARALMDRLEDEAAARGFKRLLLDTNGTLHEARAMYARRGYREISRYNDNPHAEHWFEKLIG